GGERLLAEDVHAALEREKRDLRVRVRRSGDVDEVELCFPGEQGAEVRIEARLRRRGPRRVQARRTDVGDGDDLDVGALQIRRMMSLPRDEPEAGDRTFEHPPSLPVRARVYQTKE